MKILGTICKKPWQTTNYNYRRPLLKTRPNTDHLCNYEAFFMQPDDPQSDNQFQLSCMLIHKYGKGRLLHCECCSCIWNKASISTILIFVGLKLYYRKKYPPSEICLVKPCGRQTNSCQISWVDPILPSSIRIWLSKFKKLKLLDSSMSSHLKTNLLKVSWTKVDRINT